VTTGTAPAIPRVVLQDRWDSVMEWNRNGGNPTAEYLALVAALTPLVEVVTGREIGDILDFLDDNLLFSIGEVVVEKALFGDPAGIAR
jgi:hypothetical protein